MPLQKLLIIIMVAHFITKKIVRIPTLDIILFLEKSTDMLDSLVLLIER